jgi:stage II sporulation protein D
MVATLAGAIAFVHACRTPPASHVRESATTEPTADAQPPAAPEAAAPRPATARRASGNVDVRLSDYEGATHVNVAGSSAAPVTIERRGRGVAVRDGREQAEIVLSAAAGQAGIEIGAHTYPGTVRVRARAAGGLEVTNVVDIEDYVAGVLPAEIVAWSAQPEELRAQSIAARSYAIAALDERGTKSKTPYLFDDARDQAYGGMLDEHNAKARAVRASVTRAVASTRGVVLMEGERVVDARFHAACGGDTADGRSVFPELDFDCMHSVACAPCRGELPAAREASTASPSTWSWTAPRAALDKLAARWSLGAHVEHIAPAASDAAGRWLAVEISGKASSKRVPFEEFRRALGESNLASSRIVRMQPRAGETIEDGVLFEGRGRGHGVGLCQVGMRGYARAGWNAEKILAHYYPGARLVDFE